MYQPAQVDDERRLGTLPRLAIIAAILVVVVLMTGAGALFFAGSDEPDRPTSVQRPRPPASLQDFSLIGADGREVRLSDFRGQPILLFFGYTHCPDICPTTLAEFREIKRELGSQGDQVTFMFVSVDGTRDTPAVVGSFVNRFDEDFVGLTGPEDQVRSYASDYFLYFEPASAGDTASGYLVDHTSYSYLISPDGRLNAIYPFDTAVSTVVQDLERLLEQ